MQVIITNQPTSEVTKIEGLPGRTIFHLANGHALRVGIAREKLQSSLNCWEGVRGIDLSQPPATQREIFYHPYMERSLWDVVWPIVRSNPEIQKAFRGHTTLEAIAQLSYDDLRQLPLHAYVSGPFGLYLGHPFNFICTLTDGVNEYRCDFCDGDYRVGVFVNVRNGTVVVQ